MAAVFGLAVTILPLVDLCVPLAGHERGWGVSGTGVVVAAWPVGGMAVMALVSRRGAPGSRAALAGPVAAAAGTLLLAVAAHLAVAVVAVLLVGVGTSMTTARLIPRFINATPGSMLARFHSLLQLAQIAPVLVATPMLGWAAHLWSVEVPLVVIGWRTPHHDSRRPASRGGPSHVRNRRDAAGSHPALRVGRGRTERSDPARKTTSTDPGSGRWSATQLR